MQNHAVKTGRKNEQIRLSQNPKTTNKVIKHLQRWYRVLCSTLEGVSRDFQNITRSVSQSYLGGVWKCREVIHNFGENQKYL